MGFFIKRKQHEGICVPLLVVVVENYAKMFITVCNNVHMSSHNNKFNAFLVFICKNAFFTVLWSGFNNYKEYFDKLYQGLENIQI